MTQTYDIPLSSEQIEALSTIVEIGKNQILSRAASANYRKDKGETEFISAMLDKLVLAGDAIETLRGLYAEPSQK